MKNHETTLKNHGSDDFSLQTNTQTDTHHYIYIIYSVIIIIITTITGDMEGVVENEKTGIRKGANCSQMMPPYDAAVLTMVSQPQRLVNFVASREIKALGSKFEKIYLSQAFCGTLIA